MNDEKLIELAQNGDGNAVNTLLIKYKSLASKIARSYFLTGGDIEDIIQEGMIGLYKAIMHFCKNKNASFTTFASICIKNQIQSAIKIASSDKNKALSSAMPITEQVDDDDEDGKIEIIIPSLSPSPDDEVIAKERLKEIATIIKSTLSDMEYKVLCLYLKGFNYDEISKASGLNKKSIDNALTRIKNKLSFLKN